MPEKAKAWREQPGQDEASQEGIGAENLSQHLQPSQDQDDGDHFPNIGFESEKVKKKNNFKTTQKGKLTQKSNQSWFIHSKK